VGVAEQNLEEGVHVAANEVDEMGPIDQVLIEWPDGEVYPHHE